MYDEYINNFTEEPVNYSLRPKSVSIYEPVLKSHLRSLMSRDLSFATEYQYLTDGSLLSSAKRDCLSLFKSHRREGGTMHAGLMLRAHNGKHSRRLSSVPLC